MTARLAILGGGNIGCAIARGLVACGKYRPDEIEVTRRFAAPLADLEREGYSVGTDNRSAIDTVENVLLCVQPTQVVELLRELRPALDPARHRLISVVTGVSSRVLGEAAGEELVVIRAMPNTAILLGESMTCLARDGVRAEDLSVAQGLFDALGRTLIIDEEQMTQATAVCACGTAFFLRAIRAASQGGIEIGFHAEEALFMAAQTARGAASLLLDGQRHPEREIDRVTTPTGCTIAGLNQLEHHGFSSALIRGIVTSAEKAAQLGKSSEATRRGKNP
jgi:pyrroline-5-carboxylate reductase